MVDPAGLEPARVSLQTRCTATRALGPGSRWVESNDRRQTPRGLQPRSSRQQRSPGRDRSVWQRRRDAVPIPNLAYYLVVNVRWSICRFRQKGQGFAQQGWQESNPRPPGWSRLSVPLDYTPSSVRCSVVQLAQEYKRAAPFRKRLLNDWTYVSPSYAVEGTSCASVATQLKDWAFKVRV